jgi:hypothetical protein
MNRSDKVYGNMCNGYTAITRPFGSWLVVGWLDGGYFVASHVNVTLTGLDLLD